MPRVKRTKKKNRSRKITASVEQHQGDQTQRDSENRGGQTKRDFEHQGDQTLRDFEHPELHFSQRSITASYVSHNIGISTSLPRSNGNSKISESNEIPMKYDSFHEHWNQWQRKQQLPNKDITLVGQQQTCTKADDNFLLDSIQSTSQDRALELLKGQQSFLQNTLDRALILACQHGHKYLVQTLVSLGANVHFKDTNGNTPLLICAENGFTDIVRCLLSRKADVNAVNSAGNTALILSVRSSGSAEIVKVLLEQKGINISHQNRDGYTALMKAVEVRDIDTMKMLLKELYEKQIYKNWSEVHHFKQFFGDRILDSTVQKAEVIAEKCGLGNVFRFLSTSRHTGTSPLELAIEEGDTESFNILLSCQFLDVDDVERSVTVAFGKLIKTCKIKNVNPFRPELFFASEKIFSLNLFSNKV